MYQKSSLCGIVVEDLSGYMEAFQCQLDPFMGPHHVLVVKKEEKSIG